MPLTAPMTNPRADRVTKVRALSRRSARQRAGQFLVEGPQSVRELVRFAPDTVRDLYLTDAAAERWPEIQRDALAAGRYVHPADEAVVAAMSPDAQGVLAVVDHTPATLSDLDLTQARLVVVCEELSDPGNAGTIVRAADATGADAVLLTPGSVEITSPKVVRSSAGSLFHLPVIAGVDLATVTEAARAGGMRVLAADGAGPGSLEDSPVGERVLWIFGTEARGLSDHARSLAEEVVAIPMRGRAESLNVAMAATIALYATARAQEAR